MNNTMLIATFGILVALAFIERIAAAGLRAREAVWQAHYAGIPAGAIIVAELPWGHDTWLTAYVESPGISTGHLRLRASRPLDPPEHASCLRWLRAEGFAELACCRVDLTRGDWPSESRS